MFASVAISEGRGGLVAPSDFRLAKCDTLFIRSSSQEAIKDKVQASIVASNCFSKLCRTGNRQYKDRAIIPVARWQNFGVAVPYVVSSHQISIKTDYEISFPFSA